MAAVLASPEGDADRRASKDLPHLSLSLDSPPSSSPFPSPSSSFIPPPMPGAHEYANKISIPRKKTQRDSGENNSSAQASVATALASAVAVANTSTQSPSPVKSSNVSANGTAGAVAKSRTSMNTGSEELSRLEQFASAMDRERERSNTGIAESRAKRASRASLNSSRPAPPSPSISRRTSGAHTHNPNNVSNSSHIYRESVSLSRAPSNAKNVAAAAVAAAASAETASATASKRRSRGLKIRDFAFPAEDLRHTGQGPDAARPDRSRPASEYSNGDLLNNSRRNSGWGAFRWAGSKLWGFALGGGGNGGNGKQRASDSTTDPDGFVPTSSDFARNFDVSSPQDEFPPGGGGFDHPGETDSEVNSSYDPYDVDNDDLSDYPDQDIPLLPGLYRAMYAFVPEGTAEMALAEDQIVRIVGRGGGVGWAVAEDENGSHALVPESYLEVVKLDEDVEVDPLSGEGESK